MKLTTRNIGADLFITNRHKLLSLLANDSIVVITANGVMETNADMVTTFQQNSQLLYLTGIDEINCTLLMHQQSPDQQHVSLFIPRQNEQHILWEGKMLDIAEAKAISGIEHIYYQDQFDAILSDKAKQANNFYLTSNEHARRDNSVQRGSNFYLIKKLQKNYPLHQFHRLDPLLATLREIKEPREIELIQKALEITALGYANVLHKLQPNSPEWQIEAEFIYAFKSAGSRGFAYPPIIGSGANNCILHYTANNKICQKGELLLCDVAAEYLGWKADITRTLPVSGRFSARQKSVYQGVLTILKFAASKLIAGKLFSTYFAEVLTKTEEVLLKLKLITTQQCLEFECCKSHVKKYFMHGISHHLGIDVHDVSHNAIIQQNSVYTIEPGIYLPEEGFGIRLEDCYLVTATEPYNLSAMIPIEVKDIEEQMQTNLCHE